MPPPLLPPPSAVATLNEIAGVDKMCDLARAGQRGDKGRRTEPDKEVNPYKHMESKDTKRGRERKRTRRREPTIRLSAGGKTLEMGESGTGGDGHFTLGSVSTSRLPRRMMTGACCRSHWSRQPPIRAAAYKVPLGYTQAQNPRRSTGGERKPERGEREFFRENLERTRPLPRTFPPKRQENQCQR